MLVYMKCEVKFHAFITWMLELYPPLKTSAALCLGRRYQYLPDGRLGGPWNQTGFDGEQKKNPCPYHESNSSHPVYTLLTGVDMGNKCCHDLSLFHISCKHISFWQSSQCSSKLVEVFSNSCTSYCHTTNFLLGR